MLTKAVKQISAISDKEEINTSNYVEAINYISTLYNIINKLKLVVPVKEVVFLPTFRGRVTCEKYGLPPATDEEAEMKILRMKSEHFLEDRIWEKMDAALGSISSSIVYNKDVIIIRLI